MSHDCMLHHPPLVALCGPSRFYEQIHGTKKLKRGIQITCIAGEMRGRDYSPGQIFLTMGEACFVE